MRSVIAVVVALCLVAVVYGSPPPVGDYVQGTVYFQNNQFVYEQGTIDQSGVAYGFYNDSANSTGWGHLVIHTSNAYTDSQQAYAAGYLEGVMTAYRIEQHFINVMYSYFESTEIPDYVTQFLVAQDAFFRGTTYDQMESPTPSIYWQHANLVLNQLDGLADGYNFSNPEQPLSYLQLLALNAAGDLLDIIPATNSSQAYFNKDMPINKLLDEMALHSHCSISVKLLPDFSDLYFSHTTWFPYSWLLRVMKEYSFQFSTNWTNSNRVLFSSYPGALTSIDDFYLLDSGLVVSETTNNVFNLSIYSAVNASSVLSFERVLISNRMAVDGPSWASNFSLYNSGTYNNQWVILDYNLFTPGLPVPNNTLWILEQLPGFIQAADVTNILRFNYWPSYNVPYFPTVFELSGYLEEYLLTGDTSFTHELAPRAQLFRKFQGTVTDFTSFQVLMQQNNASDPIAQGDPAVAIASRYDLRQTGALAFGSIDSKAINYELQQTGAFYAIAGPSRDSGNLPAFSWTNWTGSDSHVGQPLTFDFQWEEFNFELFSAN